MINRIDLGLTDQQFRSVLAEVDSHTEALALAEGCLLTGRTAWSSAHPRRDRSYLDGHVDGALRPFLERIHAAGLATSSSCQGGYARAGTAPAGDEYPVWLEVGPQESRRILTWGKRAPHLFVVLGVGHGGSGVLRGPRCTDRVPARVYDRARRMKAAMRAQGQVSTVYASETETYLAFSYFEGLDDVEAEMWWRTLTDRLCTAAVVVR